MDYGAGAPARGCYNCEFAIYPHLTSIPSTTLLPAHGLQITSSITFIPYARTRCQLSKPAAMHFPWYSTTWPMEVILVRGEGVHLG